MIYLIYAIHLTVCVFLILVVLLQQGKGADLSVFGGGSTQTVFGARGAATFLHKMTVGGFIAFTLTTISIGLLSSGSQGSVMSGAEVPAAVEEAVEESTTDEGTEPTAPAEDAPAAQDDAPDTAPPTPDGGSSSP